MSKKEILIKTSLKLFSQNGFNSTGIDKILQESNVSKMTLYKYFKTKDDLILAVLQRVHDIFIKEFINKINDQDLSPKNKILELFNMLTKSANKNKNVRCIFINASAEFPDINHPAHKLAFKHKLSMQTFFEEQLSKLNHKNPTHLSRTLTILAQGALIMAQIGGDKEYYQDCKKTLTKLI